MHKFLFSGQDNLADKTMITKLTLKEVLVIWCCC